MNTNNSAFLTTKRRTAPEHVAESLRSKIAAGTYGPGHLLPGRREIGAEHGVSVRTVDHAVDKLIKEGMLYAVQGRGTFVTDANKNTPIEHPHGHPRTHVEWHPREQVAVGSNLSMINRRHERLSHKTLGIIVAFNPNSPQIWTTTISAAVEQAFLQPGDVSISCNLFRGIGKSYMPLSEAIQDLVGKYASAICIIDIHGSIKESQKEISDSMSIRSSIPTVYITYAQDYMDVPTVICHQAYSGLLAVQHLLSKGATEISFIRVNDQTWVEERIAYIR